MSHSRICFLCCLLLCVLFTSPSQSFGEKNDWAEGSQDGSDGANRENYNRAGALAWKRKMGDWADREGILHGKQPYTITQVSRENANQFIEWNVTALVSEWREGKYQNQGFFLRMRDGGGDFLFHSREHADMENRPQLVIKSQDLNMVLNPVADTYLEASTYRSQGRKEQLRIGSSNPTLLRFELSGIKKSIKISEAVLRLKLFKVYGNGNAKIGVFRCQQGHDEPQTDPILGLAKNYPNDREIAKDSNVIFATNFEAKNWNEEWTTAGKMNVIDTVSEDAARKFETLDQKALRIKIAKGSTGALNTLYKFQKETGSEPEEIYFRYYLRLGEDWNQTLQGGKMPGISGTYGVAGWGGRKSHGTDGWSARGAFRLSIPEGNPLAGLHPIGTYCYHADMPGYYGDGWVWQNDYRGFLEKNRWYSIEQYLKLNTPGEKNGILRAWVDGRLAFEKTDIRFRHVEKLKIEQIWMNIYHGGTKPSPYDQHAFIDNVVIAKKYIGPMKRAE